jgi:hypothetical protein
MAEKSLPSDLSCETAEDAASNALTSIPPRIHCGPAQEGFDGDDAERVMVRHFLETLAGVALSVASRKNSQ